MTLRLSPRAHQQLTANNLAPLEVLSESDVQIIPPESVRLYCQVYQLAPNSFLTPEVDETSYDEARARLLHAVTSKNNEAVDSRTPQSSQVVEQSSMDGQALHREGGCAGWEEGDTGTGDFFEAELFPGQSTRIRCEGVAVCPGMLGLLQNCFVPELWDWLGNDFIFDVAGEFSTARTKEAVDPRELQALSQFAVLKHKRSKP